MKHRAGCRVASSRVLAAARSCDHLPPVPAHTLPTQGQRPWNAAMGRDAHGRIGTWPDGHGTNGAATASETPSHSNRNLPEISVVNSHEMKHANERILSSTPSLGGWQLAWRCPVLVKRPPFLFGDAAASRRKIPRAIFSADRMIRSAICMGVFQTDGLNSVQILSSCCGAASKLPAEGVLQASRKH